MTSINDRLNKLGGGAAAHERKLTFTPEALRAANRRERLAREQREASKGRFTLGEMVEWTPQAELHYGRVVEIVPAGRYPAKRSGLRVYGYYRDHESYVVECKGDGCYWPRVPLLRRMEGSGDDA